MSFQKQQGYYNKKQISVTVGSGVFAGRRQMRAESEEYGGYYMSEYLSALKKEIAPSDRKQPKSFHYLTYLGVKEHYTESVPITRAYACESQFLNHKKKVFHNDLILGSQYGMLAYEYGINDAVLEKSRKIAENYGKRGFVHNSDHYAPDYAAFLAEGVDGILNKIQNSLEKYKDDDKKMIFLQSAEIAMRAFGRMIAQYGEKAESVIREDADLSDCQKQQLLAASKVCKKISCKKPESFREALQLVWMVHTAFLYESRYAMALGRLDQYLYPYYERDIQSGVLTREFAKALVECTLFKIGESRYFGGDDVVNIAIGGVKPDGSDAINELSYIILEAVRDCGIAGPNLSARLHGGMPDRFLDECLKVIGTGIGYPALMNDDVNIAALQRCGYELEDCRDYCMVGCIENFLPGKQPPWSDGRYNSPFYLELALNQGQSWQDGMQYGPRSMAAEEMQSMEDVLQCLHAQMEVGAAEYMALFRNENARYNKEHYTQPFLSCLCNDCIERGCDINDGGTKYPSVHGAGCVGIGTVADSLAAIEQVVFVDKYVTMAELLEALKADFVGYEELQKRLLKAPKYGNDDERADKYAVWFVEEHYRLFEGYRTPDGGRIYIAIASNVQNISAGKEVAATPDGRKCHEPLSDAASPMHGMDKEGPTAVLLSVTKPDYTKAACGTVLNQKYSPSVFADPEKRAKLTAMLRVYFARGGQEVQINSVSRQVLKDAMDNPEKYQSLVVRVSGFSQLYVTLRKDIQEDILKRTEHM